MSQLFFFKFLTYTDIPSPKVKMLLSLTCSSLDVMWHIAALHSVRMEVQCTTLVVAENSNNSK